MTEFNSFYKSYDKKNNYYNFQKKKKIETLNKEFKEDVNILKEKIQLTIINLEYIHKSLLIKYKDKLPFPQIETVGEAISLKSIVYLDSLISIIEKGHYIQSSLFLRYTFETIINLYALINPQIKYTESRIKDLIGKELNEEDLFYLKGGLTPTKLIDRMYKDTQIKKFYDDICIHNHSSINGVLSEIRFNETNYKNNVKELIDIMNSFIFSLNLAIINFFKEFFTDKEIEFITNDLKKGMKNYYNLQPTNEKIKNKLNFYFEFKK